MSQYTEQDRELLEAQANQLGVDFHPNISSEKLAARIAEVMEGREPQEKERPAKGETKEQRRQRKHKEAMALVRCLIVCNDPNKREWPGEWLGVSNGAGVQIRKLVPYNQPDKPFHLPRIMVTCFVKNRFRSLLLNLVNMALLFECLNPFQPIPLLSCLH